jgi:hypothetical protein
MTLLEEIRAALPVPRDFSVKIFISGKFAHELSVELWNNAQPSPERLTEMSKRGITPETVKSWRPTWMPETISAYELSFLSNSTSLYGYPVFVTDTVERFKIGVTP